MAYDGWLELGGAEFINISRTAQLAESMGIDSVWTNAEDVQWIQDTLGGVDYDLVTAAPWYDAGYPASAEFAGFISLGFPGLDDSTLTSAPTEYVTDGGHPGKPRNATLSIVASVGIVATTERGADYGKRWLDRLLRGDGGNTGNPFCVGSDLRYFRWPGQSDEDSPPVAHRRNVRVTRGTSVTRKRITDCSATFLTTFTLTAADPYEYGDQEQVLFRLGVVPEFGEPALATNLITNPSFEVNTTGWSVSGSGITLTSEVLPPPGGTGVRGERVLQIVDTGAVNASGAQLSTDLTVTGSTTYMVSAYVKGPVGKIVRMRTIETAGGTQAINVNHTLLTGDWVRINQVFTTSPGATALDVRFLNPNNAAMTYWVDAVMVTQGAPLLDYFDGNTLPTYDPDTDTWTAYRWNGTSNASTSSVGESEGVAVGSPLLVSQGSVALLEQACPVWDYSPIFDPLHPALVASPTAPEFYPDGWDIADGMTFNRYWARIGPVSPSELVVVPVLTLTTLTTARMVRVSIWPNLSDFDDLCDPLFTAIVTYLPAAVEFVIDGEQQVSYVWDGASPVVRRTDSLVYGTDATPVKWTAFNDPAGFLVTLDLFSDAESGDFDETGDGTVELELAFVPKSD